MSLSNSFIVGQLKYKMLFTICACLLANVALFYDLALDKQRAFTNIGFICQQTSAVLARRLSHQYVEEIQSLGETSYKGNKTLFSFLEDYSITYGFDIIYVLRRESGEMVAYYVHCTGIKRKEVHLDKLTTKFLQSLQFVKTNSHSLGFNNAFSYNDHQDSTISSYAPVLDNKDSIIAFVGVQVGKPFIDRYSINTLGLYQDFQQNLAIINSLFLTLLIHYFLSFHLARKKLLTNMISDLQIEATLRKYFTPPRTLGPR